MGGAAGSNHRDRRRVVAPERHVDQPQAGRVLDERGVPAGLQPPHEARRPVGELVDRAEAVGELAHHRRVERTAHPRDVDLGE
jgi:hypothetical protein